MQPRICFIRNAVSSSEKPFPLSINASKSSPPSHNSVIIMHYLSSFKYSWILSKFGWSTFFKILISFSSYTFSYSLIFFFFMIFIALGILEIFLITNLTSPKAPLPNSYLISYRLAISAEFSYSLICTYLFTELRDSSLFFLSSCSTGLLMHPQAPIFNNII